jgi:hypothetical protein
MSMDDTLNGCQPDAGAFRRLRRVETLEDPEQFIDTFHIKPDSIVSNKHHYLILFVAQASYFDFGLRAHAGEFYGIRDQIDKHQGAA